MNPSELEKIKLPVTFKEPESEISYAAVLVKASIDCDI